MADKPNDKLRDTSQRRMILDALRGTRSHPTAEQVHEMVRSRAPRVSLATVYRNLEAFADKGIVWRLDLGEGYRRYDGDVTPHYHFRCERCGQVQDFFAADPRQAEQMAMSCFPGAQVRKWSLSASGLCGACAAVHPASGKHGKSDEGQAGKGQAERKEKEKKKEQHPDNQQTEAEE